MPKLTLISGARDFLRKVFAHRNRMRLAQIDSFRFSCPENLRAEPRKDDARLLSAKDWNRANWTEM